MVCPTLGLGHDVIHGQVAEGEVVLAASAAAFLLSVERVPMRLVGRQLADVRPSGGLSAMVHLWQPPACE